MKHMCFFLDKPLVYRPDSLSLTLQLDQEFLERVGSYHWAILAPKGSGIFQEFINMLAVVPQHFCFDFDGCAFGSRTKRRSRLVSSASTFSALRWECSHLNFSCTFWDTVALGIAGPLDGHGRGAVRRKPGQIHFISPCYVLSSAVLRDTSRGSLNNQASSFQRAPCLPGPSMPLTDTEVPSLPP